MNVVTPENPPVVDASVAIKWFLPEIHDQFARRLLDGERFAGDQRLQVPELFFCEVGNILWKRSRRGEMTPEKAQAILDSLVTLPFNVHSHRSLMEAALTIASEMARTVYDSLYLALAIREQTVMITADERFHNALQNGPLAAYLLWIEEIEIDTP